MQTPRGRAENEEQHRQHFYRLFSLVLRIHSRDRARNDITHSYEVHLRNGGMRTNLHRCSSSEWFSGRSGRTRHARKVRLLFHRPIASNRHCIAEFRRRSVARQTGRLGFRKTNLQQKVMYDQLCMIRYVARWQLSGLRNIDEMWSSRKFCLVAEGICVVSCYEVDCYRQWKGLGAESVNEVT